MNIMFTETFNLMQSNQLLYTNLLLKITTNDNLRSRNSIILMSEYQMRKQYSYLRLLIAHTDYSVQKVCVLVINDCGAEIKRSANYVYVKSLNVVLV